MLMRHRAVRKDRHEGEQRSTNARVHHRAVRKDIHAGMCPGRCGQKRCVQSAVARCASLHVSRSTRWQRRGQKSHTRNHCHLCHACRSSCLSIYLSICKLENEAIRRDFLNFFTWQLETRNKSARLKLTTSSTNDFCESSSKNGKISAALTPSCQFVLRFFCSTYLKYCACHENWLPGHTKCCTYRAKSS